jgi:ABC-type histidine transport system ATPase subunit
MPELPTRQGVVLLWADQVTVDGRLLDPVKASRPHVLLMDEPTNHLSIALVDELTEALQVSEAAVVLATHDRQLRRDTSSWSQLSLTSLTGRAGPPPLRG